MVLRLLAPHMVNVSSLGASIPTHTLLYFLLTIAHSNPLQMTVQQSTIICSVAQEGLNRSVKSAAVFGVVVSFDYSLGESQQGESIVSI